MVFNKFYYGRNDKALQTVSSSLDLHNLTLTELKSSGTLASEPVI